MTGVNTANAIIKAIRQKKGTNAQKAQPIYDIVRTFIHKKKLLLYGGSAINLLMPQGRKIYKQHDTPDYDVYSFSPKEHAFELADDIVNEGYKFTEVKPGLHKGTFKVFVDFVPVVDITGLSRGIFDRLQKRASHVMRLRTVPVDFLKMSIHLELSRPEGHIERWQKIYPRLKTLNELFPVSNACKTPTPSQGTDIAKRIISDVVKDGKGRMLTGLSAVGYYTGNNIIGVPVEVLSADMRGCAADVVGTIGGVARIIEVQGNEVVPESVTVMVGDEVICKVYGLNACAACRTVGETIVISYDGLLAHLYGSFLNKEDKNVRCAIASLLNAPPEPKNRFPSTCIGRQETFLNLKKERWESKRPLSVYRPATPKKFLSNKA